MKSQYYINVDGELMYYHSFFNDHFYVIGVSEVFNEIEFIWS